MSGGADSVAMLAALDAIRREQPDAAFSLHCIHVEHGLRAEESRGDADFVQAFCAEHDIPCRVETIPPGAITQTAADLGTGIEAAARLYRRRAWFKQARCIESRSVAAGSTRPVRILVAHTRDDMLETALMRVFRGAGPAGLAAMPASRGRILRPLLSLTRADVVNYLTEKKIRWREDSSNADIRFLRNRVRRCLVPRLDEWFPNWRIALASLAETQSLAAACIAQQARLKWTAGGTRTCAKTFFSLPQIVREEALFQAVDNLVEKKRGEWGGKVPVTVRRSVLRHFCRGQCKAADLGPARVRISQNGEQIVLSVEKSSVEKSSVEKSSIEKFTVTEYGFSLLITGNGLYTLKGIRLTVSPASDSDTANNSGENPAPDSFFALLPLAVRKSFNNDYIVQRGRNIRPPELKKNGKRVLSAVDRLGVAAFIGPDGLLACRDDATVQCGVDTAAGRFITVIP